jgi:16S rRNA processing protein RimM
MGELLCELLTDFPERFAERSRLFLRAAAAAQPREVRLERHWLHKGRLVLKLQGIDSIEAAELLRGHDVVIPRAERAPLDEDSVYIGDLVGCLLHDRTTGTDAGEIIDVDRESSNTALIVVRRPGEREELLIPFAKAYQPHIDLEGRRMEMSLPAGLLALNDPLTPEERLAMAAAEPEPAAPQRQKKRS